MQWVQEDEAKPSKWEVVAARCENSSGDVVDLDAYWTGQCWRIIGQKSVDKRLRVTLWAFKIAAELT
jgi:hypothetical protein